MTTTEYRKPVPQPDEESAPYFDGAKRGELMIRRCKSCRAYLAPSAERCDMCLDTDPQWVKASGKGTLHTFGLMHQMYHPAWQDEMPYNIATVELAEGPRLVANIVDCPNDQLTVGMAVEAVFDAVTPDVTIVRFRPAR